MIPLVFTKVPNGSFSGITPKVQTGLNESACTDACAADDYCTVAVSVGDNVCYTYQSAIYTTASFEAASALLQATTVFVKYFDGTDGE